MLCYIVVSVQSAVNLIKDKSILNQAADLLEQRTSLCLERLHSIRIRKKVMINRNYNAKDAQLYDNYLEKKAMIALGIYKKNQNYFELSASKPISNGKLKITRFIKEHFFDEIVREEVISLRAEKLNCENSLEILKSGNSASITLCSNDSIAFSTIQDLFKIWVNSLHG